ncbi:MAG: hypothetical protein JNL92_15120 [Opitutaceae bacterium]|nr:hypothetical protein [Opitutaceae bacterium]
MPDILNASAYLFTPLADLPSLRARLLERAVDLGLKGTVLLSPEGINLFVAGTQADVDAFLSTVRGIPGLEQLTAKLSPSAHAPFGHMRVKLKREIIAFGVPEIDPARQPSRRLAPETLKAWLDAGRPITLLDTRNTYEIERGTFRGARAAGISRFRDFPRAVATLPPELKDQPVVTFCTGGIRCEKAAPYLEREGFKEVYQLDGGILKYFEQCGGAHFDGECFVFDERESVDAGLRAVRGPSNDTGPEPAPPDAARRS